MATNEQLHARLNEAESALHKLMTGMSEVEISYDGRIVRYTSAKSGDLRAYIRELQARLGIKTGRSKAIVARF